MSARLHIRETPPTRRFGSRILTVLASMLIAVAACWGNAEQDAVHLHRYRLLVDAGVNEVTFWMTSQATGWPFPLGNVNFIIYEPDGSSIDEIVRTELILDPHGRDPRVRSERIETFFPERPAGERYVNVALSVSRNQRIGMQLRFVEQTENIVSIEMESQSALFTEDEDINCRSATEPTIEYQVEAVEGGTITELPVEDPRP